MCYERGTAKAFASQIPDDAVIASIDRLADMISKDNGLIVHPDALVRLTHSCHIRLNNLYNVLTR